LRCEKRLKIEEKYETREREREREESLLLAQIVGVNSWRRDEKRLKIERKEIE
jgi:hypothetical protein